MTMFHGDRFYAVYSRDRGMLFKPARFATIKIYRSDNAAFPARVLDRPGQIAEFRRLMGECGDDRGERGRIMQQLIENKHLLGE